MAFWFKIQDSKFKIFSFVLIKRRRNKSRLSLRATRTLCGWGVARLRSREPQSVCQNRRFCQYSFCKPNTTRNTENSKTRPYGKLNERANSQVGCWFCKLNTTRKTENSKTRPYGGNLEFCFLNFELWVLPPKTSESSRKSPKQQHLNRPKMCVLEVNDKKNH